ncbi:MAG: hypothetical protein LBB51_03480 [Zoogloeaceae bacterium]|nr:hypothetical protein [Zoogloeaceae bacterium]
MMTALLLGLAIVTQDQIPLRAAPTENAARHATLSQGDALEVRGVRDDYLQVYDHRRERAGYIRATQVGQYALTPEEAPRLKAIVDFLKNQPGYEALGVGHIAAFLKVAPAEAIDADIFEALGKMADRLAWRASRLSGSNNATAAKTVSEHLEVAASYGVSSYSVEHHEKMTLCYEGEAWRRVLALPARPEQKANAALSLTRHDCLKTNQTSSARLETDFWRAEILEQVLAHGARKGGLPEHLRNRLKIRAAGVWASIAHHLTRQPKSNPDSLLKAGQQAETHLAGVDKKSLKDGDLQAWHEAAIRVGASRWSALPQTVALPVQNRPGIRVSAGEPGQTCIEIIEGGKQASAPKTFARCTYGQVWTSSLTVSPDGQMMTLAVQPLENWREMWVFRREEKGWQIEAIPPSAENPELGYIEFAGWVPGNKQLLVARETIENGRNKTSFELWDRATLKVEKRADKPGNLSTFYRWQDPLWKGGTMALR